MSSDFDPYLTWLGIPANEQPPNYYRLLGLRLFETNGATIRAAADRLTAQLRAISSGKQRPHAERLINEVTAARTVLLDPRQKANYDLHLRRPLELQNTGLLAEEVPHKVALAAAAELERTAEPRAAPTDRRAAHWNRASASMVRLATSPWGAGLGFAFLLALLLVLLWPRNPRDESDLLTRSPPATAGATHTRLILYWPRAQREGAEIRLDGKPLMSPQALAENTNDRLEFEISPGKHALRIQRAGFVPLDRTFEAPQGSRIEIFPQLEPRGSGSVARQQ